MIVSSRLAILVGVSAIVSVSGAACVDISAGNATYTETVEKRFAVSGAPALAVTTFDGSIEVSTWDRQEVLVTVEKHAVDKSAADRIVVTAAQNGNAINVDVAGERSGLLHLDFGSFNARVTVTIPVHAAVAATTGDGRIIVRDVQGDVNARTGDGAIRLERVTGGVDANSGDGSIDIDGSIRKLTVRTGDGRVHVHAVNDTPDADWSLNTGDGSVLIEVPESFGAELHAATGDGRVQVVDLPFSSDATSRGSARGRIGRGGPTVNIRSGDGSITVRRAGSSERSTSADSR